VARILLGVTGGIASYKACELVRRFVRAGHEVIPLVSPSAERFVTAETFAALARRPVGEEMHAEARLKSGTGSLYPHLERAELLVIAPLTANTLAKLAHGLADSVLTEAALAHRGPVVVAPAMNDRMWSHPATQANADVLRERGIVFVGPTSGELAEGGEGVGRMAEPDEIFDRCVELLGSGSLAGRRVVVSAGGTREPLDAVRYVGNRSSGRMGVALAAEAARRGADVTLLAANLAVAPPPGVAVVETPTAEAMLEAALARADADLIVMAAAVADYRPSERREGKRPKDDSAWTVELEPTTDILRELAARRANGTVVVGFAADFGESGLARAREKLEAKGANLFVFNDVSRSDVGFDAEDNEVVIVSARGEERIDKGPKEQIAAAVLDRAERLLTGEGG
jgi:phosphopantothenoylcysteine decarboxylase/phosphopantothenate--cysteine ligase